MTNLVLHARHPTAVGISGYAETVVVRLRIRPGNWVVHGRVVLENADSDEQTATVKTTSMNGTNVIDEVNYALPRRQGVHGGFMVVSLQGVLQIEQQHGEEIIDLRCATYKGVATHAKLLAIEVGFLADTTV
jgi:hypothetical protein